MGQLGVTKFSGQKLKMSQALKNPVHQSTLIRLSLFPLLGKEHNPVIHLWKLPMWIEQTVISAYAEVSLLKSVDSC